MRILPVYCRFQALLLFLALSGPAFPQTDNTDSLRRVTDSMPESADKAGNYVRLAKLYIYIDEDTAWTYSEQAIQLGRKTGNAAAEAEGYYLKSLLIKWKNDFREALALDEKYLEMVRAMNDSNRLAKGYYHQGNLFKELLEYEQSMSSFKTSLALYTAIRDTTGIIAVYNSIGTVYVRLSAYDSAAHYYLIAARTYELTGQDKHLGVIFDNLADVYLELGQYETARKYALQGIGINEKYGNREEVATGYTTLGRIANDEFRHEEALEYYRTGEKIYIELGDVIGQCDIKNNIGIILNRQGKHSEAVRAYDEALEGYRSKDYTRGVIVVLGNKAVVFTHQDKYQEAIALHEQALKLCEEFGAPDYELDALDNLSWCWMKMGDFKKAYDYHVRYTDLKDSIFDIEKTRVINDLTLKYEKQKDQAQILELEKTNLQKDLDLRKRTSQRNGYFFSGITVLALASFLLLYFRQRAVKDRIIADHKIRQLEEEKKLMAARLLVEGQEEERKRIARELHDGLGVLLSVTRMQFTSIRDTSPENRPLIDKAAQLLEQAAGDVRKISHNMMPGLLTKLGLYEAVEDLVENLNESGNISARCEIPGDLDRLPENQEIMLYRVIQEMVNNTLKHAGAENIRVLFRKEPNHVVFEYSDNGKGFEVEKVLESRSIGLKSIQSRVSFLNGTMDVRSKQGEGVHYAIRVPV